MLLKKKWRTEGRGDSSESDGQREANTGPEISSQPHNLTPDWVFLKWKLLNLTIAEWWQPRKFILWIKVWIHATLKWCRYFFNLKPSALKYISIKAIEVIWKFYVSKMFRSYCPKSLLKKQNWAKSDLFHTTSYWVTNPRPESRPLYSQCGAHSSQPQRHSLLFFKGSVCVTDRFNTRASCCVTRAL